MRPQARGHGGQRGDELGAEFDDEGEVEQVVEQGDRRHQERGGDDAEEIPLGDSRDLAVAVQQHHAEHEGRDNAHATGFWGDMLMRLARVGPVRHADVDHHPHDNGGKHCQPGHQGEVPGQGEQTQGDCGIHLPWTMAETGAKLKMPGNDDKCWRLGLAWGIRPSQNHFAGFLMLELRA